MYKNPIYKLLEINIEQEKDLLYLIELSDKMSIIDNVKEHIFQFNPTYDENGRNQLFSIYYRECLITEIIIFLLEKIAYNIVFKEETEILDLKVEDYTDYYFNDYLDEKENSQLTKSLLNNNLLNLNIEEIYKLFYNENKSYLNIYFDK